MKNLLKYGAGILLTGATLYAIGHRINEVLSLKRELNSAHTHIYTIKKGDRVYNLARIYFEDENKNHSIEDMMDETKERNPQLENLGLVHPGDRISLLCNGKTKCPDNKSK